MLAAGARKMEIHRAVRQRFNVQWRQCDRYIRAVQTVKTPQRAWLPRAHTPAPAPEAVSPYWDEMLKMSKLCYPQG
jgi:hypothetical protein